MQLIFKKVLFVFILIFAVFSSIYVYGSEFGPDTSGPIATSFDNNVDITNNLFNGQLSVNLPVVSLSGRNGMDLNIMLSYSTYSTSDTGDFAIEDPISSVGDGWSINMGHITHDTLDGGDITPEGLEHKYHLNLPGSESDKIIRYVNQTGAYYGLEKNPYFKINETGGTPSTRNFVANSPGGTYYEFNHKTYLPPKHRRI